MAEQRPSTSERFAVEREREERALAERLWRAGQRPPAENLAIGIELMRTAEDFRSAFAKSSGR